MESDVTSITLRVTRVCNCRKHTQNSFFFSFFLVLVCPKVICVFMSLWLCQIVNILFQTEIESFFRFFLFSVFQSYICSCLSDFKLKPFYFKWNWRKNLYGLSVYTSLMQDCKIHIIICSILYFSKIPSQ